DLLLFERRHHHAPSTIGAWKLITEPALDPEQIVPRLLRRDALAKAAEHAVETGVARTHQAGWRLRRHPNLGVRRGVTERRRHHPDDRPLPAAQHQDSADHRAIGIPSRSPERVAHDARPRPPAL